MLAATKHVGFYTMSKAIPAAMKEELAEVGIWISCTTYTVRLTHQARGWTPGGAADTGPEDTAGGIGGGG